MFILLLIILELLIFIKFSNKSFKFTFPIIFFITYFLSLVYFSSDYFTWVGIDESFFYILQTGVEWADIKSSYFLLSSIFILLLLWLLISIYLYKKYNTSKKILNKHSKIILIFFAIVLILLHPTTLSFWKYFLTGNSSVQKQEKYLNTWKKDFKDWFYHNYIVPEVSENPINKNLIYIYLESFEQNLLDQELFPWLATNLSKLKNDNISFNNVEQIPWTQWTIAWMVASQCWIPLFLSSWWNSMSWIDYFLPWAECLWDFLKKSWYFLEYIWGASLEFAWKGNFYKTHSFDKIVWKNEIEEISDNNLEKNNWWIYDNVLFWLAFEEIQRLYNKKEKFAIKLLTLSTHNPDWFISKTCLERPFKTEIENAYYCSDKEIWEFVNKITSSPSFKNTIIVIASDHLAMKNDITNTLEKKPRRNLFIIIDSDDKSKLSINKKASTMDIWATVLDKMWFEINSFWLWRSLLSDFFTFSESFSDSKKILQWKPEIKSFWDFPIIWEKWIYINLKKEFLLIWQRKMNFPVLLTINNENTINSVRFNFDSPEKLETFLVDIWNNEKIFFIDYCKNISNKINSNDLKTGFCLVSWTKQNIKFTYLNESMYYKRDDREKFNKRLEKNLY